MTYLLIVFTTICTIGSQLLLKFALTGLGTLASGDKIAFLAKVATSPWVALALALQVSGYVVWFFVITREKLGIAFALSGSLFYITMALLGWGLFGERLTLPQWSGIAMITIGVLFLARG